MGRIALKLFGQSLEDVRFDVRRFRGGQDPAMREHIETIGFSFLAGYHGALELKELGALEEKLEALDDTYRGFAYEGAGMGCFLLDRLLPWSRRFEGFLEGRGGGHVYMAYVGAGWAIARLPIGKERALRILAGLHPLYHWLAYDGWGFHQGFFHWPTAVEGPRAVPRSIRDYGRRAFDQGLGRSLWFVDGGDVERMPRTVAAFGAERHADLWAGLGLAATYASGVEEAALDFIFDRAREAGHAEAFAQGSAFAAEARRKAGNLLPMNERSARRFTGLSAEEAASVTDITREDLPVDRPTLPAYEVWRQRIQQHLVEQRSAVGAAAVGAMARGAAAGNRKDTDRSEAGSGLRPAAVNP